MAKPNEMMSIEEHHAKMSIKEKIIDVIERNYSQGNDVEVHPYSRAEGPATQIIFTRYEFDSMHLAGIFRYWGLKWEEWVVEWNVQALSNKRVRVLLWIKDEPKPK
nr:hypothetical protein [Candidatus Sigynarchaeota archaeon]